MDWLNYHHLRYFWTVARKGGVRKAAEELHVSQPSISAQLRLLEEAVGEKLFRRSGRNLVLTEMGEVVLSYADEIFSAGRELMNAVRQQSGGRALRLNVGMTDSLPKLIAFEILKPAFQLPYPVHVVCRQAEIAPLVGQLQAHRLDIVLADEPASSSLKAKTFNHPLGSSAVTFCAVRPLAAKLRKGFPQSLDGAPALLPSENMGMRAALEKWFDKHNIRPLLVGEFEDSALMEVAASGALGFTAVHSAAAGETMKHFGLQAIEEATDCTSDFFAITVERRVKHPAAVAITEHAHTQLFA
jgi:LysR family transcriptional activator of nhaA